jgi:hypothetical protein
MPVKRPENPSGGLSVSAESASTLPIGGPSLTRVLQFSQLFRRAVAEPRAGE